MKLNIGCGKQTWPDFYCVDAVPHPKASRAPDLLHAFAFDGEVLTNPLPLADGVADEVHSYHFLEHVYAWEAPALVREFARLLKAGGRLVLELPDLRRACQNLIAGTRDQMSMWGLYGDPGHRDPWMCHRWGYTPETVTALLQANGFEAVRILPPQTHGAKVKRDMRVEATKA
jgi:predicted SAM-dependent methyltransferase